MTPADDAAAALDDPTCAECGDPAETAYVPVRDGDPLPAVAVCKECGWTDVGFAGCAPEADDLDADALVRVDPDGSASVTDE